MIYKKTIIFRLKYSYNIKKYNFFYTKPNLIGYNNNNLYINNTKSKKLIIEYIYFLNKVTDYLLNKKVKIIIIFKINSLDKKVYL